MKNLSELRMVSVFLVFIGFALISASFVVAEDGCILNLSDGCLKSVPIVGVYGSFIQKTSDGGYLFRAENQVIKADSNMNLEWNRQFDVLTNYSINDFKETSDGGFIFTGSISFPETGSDVLVIKTDFMGNIQFINSFHDYTVEDELFDINTGQYINWTSDELGLYIFENSDKESYSILGKGNSFTWGFYPYFLKIDSDGNFTFNYRFLKDRDTISEAMQENNGDLIFLTDSEIDDDFFIKMDEEGNILLTVSLRFLGTHDDYYQVIETNDANYAIVGASWSHSPDDFYVDASLFKINSNGSMEFSKYYDAEFPIRLSYGLSVDDTADGGYILTGYVESNPYPRFEGYLMKTDSLGNKEWILYTNDLSENKIISIGQDEYAAISSSSAVRYWIEQPTCDDEIKNGNETDVDCGGSCSHCAAGQQCSADADCSSPYGEMCVNGVCGLKLGEMCGTKAAGLFGYCVGGYCIQEWNAYSGSDSGCCDVSSLGPCQTCPGGHVTSKPDGSSCYDYKDSMSGELSYCMNGVCINSPGCGDGYFNGAQEVCDDGNLINGDGCDNGCNIEPGWICNGDPSVCTEVPKNNTGEECNNEGFNCECQNFYNSSKYYAIQKWSFRDQKGDYVLDEKNNLYSYYNIDVNGDMKGANWTANPCVISVLVKAGNDKISFDGGLSGSVYTSKKDISHITFCGYRSGDNGGNNGGNNGVPEFPAFSVVIAVFIATLGIMYIRKS